MKIRPEIVTSLSHPAVVGTVHSPGSLAAARKLGRHDCDWLELRLDNFFPDPRHLDSLLRLAPKLPCPRIVTVRHASEGGMAKGITPPERRALYLRFLEVAGLVDIELRSSATMREVLRHARQAGVGVILSHHNFHSTPRPARLRELARRARDAGASIFKVATFVRNPRDLATLIEFLANEKSRLPLAVMGMGPYGKVSRLVLAQAGSCLNYGYLGAPNASGQWPAALLKARIAELQTPL
jgi:3-dehydroquinate dehydratase-1